MSTLPFLTLPLITLFSLTHAIDKTSNPSLNARLKIVPTNLDRSSLLSNHSAWQYDFFSQPTYTFTPGSVVNANAATFPALTGIGMTIAMLNLGPCAMLPPHAHPRATNLVVAITGNTTSFMFSENGADLITTNLLPGILTIFPTASLHAMQNNGCENAQLISALNSEDPGTLTYMNGMDQLPLDMIRAAFGNPALDGESLGRGIPPIGTGSVLGSEECLERCGMGRG